MFYNVRYPINIARAQACTYLEVKQAWHIVKNASTGQITIDESVCKYNKRVIEGSQPYVVNTENGLNIEDK